MLITTLYNIVDKWASHTSKWATSQPMQCIQWIQQSKCQPHQAI